MKVEKMDGLFNCQYRSTCANGTARIMCILSPERDRQRPVAQDKGRAYITPVF